MKSSTRRLALSVLAIVMAACSLLAWAQTQKPAKQTSAKEERAPAAAQSARKMQPLNVKPGLWETTRTMKTAGEMPIPAEMLNRLTPEQRARMEERMKAHSAAHATTETQKDCVTREDLAKDRLKLTEAKECTTNVLDSTGTTLRGNLVCDMEGMHSTGTLELLAVDSEHVNGSYHSTMTGNGHTMNVEGTWTSKWLSSSCGNVK